MSVASSRTPGLPSPWTAHVPVHSWITTRVQAWSSSVRRPWVTRRSVGQVNRALGCLLALAPGGR